MKEAPKPIYVVVSGRVLQPKKLAPYAAASGPLAEAAGLEFLANSKPVLLEGKWPHEEGTVAVEKFSSKEELEKFWNSDAYREAKKLRDGVVDIDFIIAVEVPEEEQ
ncbi:MAG: hypothetical protein ACI9JM_002707 [Halioglobus sp.]|jgi:uncharacterized protein (DUF1330 family)